MTTKKLVLLIMLCCNAFSLISQEKSDDSISAAQTADQAIKPQKEPKESAVDTISQTTTQPLEETKSETVALPEEPSDISTETEPIAKETKPANIPADASTPAQATEIEGISEKSQDAAIIEPSTPDVEAVATPEESAPEEIEPEASKEAPEEEEEDQSTQESTDTPTPTLIPNTQEDVTPEVLSPESTKPVTTEEVEDKTTQKAPATDGPTKTEKRPTRKIEQIKPIVLEPIIIKHYPPYKGSMLFLDSSMIV